MSVQVSPIWTMINITAFVKKDSATFRDVRSIPRPHDPVSNMELFVNATPVTWKVKELDDSNQHM